MRHHPRGSLLAKLQEKGEMASDHFREMTLRSLTEVFKNKPSQTHVFSSSFLNRQLN